MAHNSDRTALESYFNGLESPYMGVDAIAMRDDMEKDGNMPHMVINQAGEVHIIKDGDETGWTPHPGLPQTYFTIGIQLNDNAQASEAQIGKLREVRDIMRGTQALAEYDSPGDEESPRQDSIRLGQAFDNAGQMRVALGQEASAQSHTLPVAYKMGLIRSEQALRLSMARAQDAYDTALDEVAELQEHYETLKEKAGTDIDTGWASSIYDKLMHNLGTYIPVMTASTATGFAGSLATPATGIALGGATAVSLNSAVDHGLAILDKFQEMAVDLTDPVAMRDALDHAGRMAEDILDHADTEALYGGIRGIATSFAPLKMAKSIPVEQIGPAITKGAQPVLSSIASGASRAAEYVAKQFDTDMIRQAASGLFGVETAKADNGATQLPRDSALTIPPESGLSVTFYNINHTVPQHDEPGQAVQPRPPSQLDLAAP